MRLTNQLKFHKLAGLMGALLVLAFGLGLMFFCGKVLPSPVPAGIAGGITLGVAGFVVVVVEALRDAP